jgi:hypothetical protein
MPSLTALHLTYVLLALRWHPVLFLSGPVPRPFSHGVESLDKPACRLAFVARRRLLPFCLFICLFVYLLVCIFVYLYICLKVCLLFISSERCLGATPLPPPPHLLIGSSRIASPSSRSPPLPSRFPPPEKVRFSTSPVGPLNQKSPYTTSKSVPWPAGHNLHPERPGWQTGAG